MGQLAIVTSRSTTKGQGCNALPIKDLLPPPPARDYVVSNEEMVGYDFTKDGWWKGDAAADAHLVKLGVKAWTLRTVLGLNSMNGGQSQVQASRLCQLVHLGPVTLAQRVALDRL